MQQRTEVVEPADELRAVVQAFLEKEASEATVRALIDSELGWDRRTWARAAAELGVAGLCAPQHFGGADATAVELGAAFEEAGRVLWCAPLLASIGLALPALLSAPGSERRDRLIVGLVDGSRTATVAGLELDGAVSAVRAGDRWRLAGSAHYVLDGASADAVLVGAVVEGEPTLFLVEDGVTVEPLPTMDSTRRLAHLRFDDAVADLIDPAAADTFAGAIDFAELMLAAEQLGGASRCLEEAVEYAKTRVQFGRPIGSFQAVKHRLADVLIDVEFARSILADGLHTAVTRPADLPFATSLARVLCTEVYLRAAATNIQVHGGIGITWEHSAHLYVKRAKSSELLFRSPRWHRRRLAELLDLPTPA